MNITIQGRKEKNSAHDIGERPICANKRYKKTNTRDI